MSNNEKKYKIFISISLLVSLALAVARVVLIRNHIEMDSLENSDGWYYLEGTGAPLAFAITCVVLVVLFFAGSVLFAGKINGVFKSDRPFVVFSSALTGMMLFTLVIYYLYRIIFEKQNYDYGFIVIILLTVLSAVYFMMISSRRTRERFAKLLPVFSMVPVLLTAVRLLYDFVARSLTVTASSYSYHLLGLAFLMLFLCCEGRYTVGYRRKRIYVALGLITNLLTLVYCVPALFLALFWPLHFTDITVYCMADLVLTIYIYCRMLSVEKIEEVPASME